MLLGTNLLSADAVAETAVRKFLVFCQVTEHIHMASHDHVYKRVLKKIDKKSLVLF